MNSSRVEEAVVRLERNLPIRLNQLQLPPGLRQLHQRILRHYLEHGVAPAAGELSDVEDWQSAVERLAAQHIVVLNDAGAISGAYPFVDEARGFRVTTRHGTVNAMCAFDALAISSMFGLPARIESTCRLSGQDIVIEQDDEELQVIEPAEPVFAAIDWQAAAGADSCSATLCLEMMFIAGQAAAADWSSHDPASREVFDLPAARAFIAAVFVPMMR